MGMMTMLRLSRPDLRLNEAVRQLAEAINEGQAFARAEGTDLITNAEHSAVIRHMRAVGISSWDLRTRCGFATRYSGLNR